MKKKLLSTLLAASMVAACLVGCGNDSGDTTGGIQALLPQVIQEAAMQAAATQVLMRAIQQATAAQMQARL